MLVLTPCRLFLDHILLPAYTVQRAQMNIRLVRIKILGEEKETFPATPSVVAALMGSEYCLPLPTGDTELPRSVYRILPAVGFRILTAAVMFCHKRRTKHGKAENWRTHTARHRRRHQKMGPGRRDGVQ